MIKPLDLRGYTKGKRWCVPSAVSLLTGLPLAVTTSRLAFMQDTTYQGMEGAWPEEAFLILREAGFRVQRVDLFRRYPRLVEGPTLKRYMTERPSCEKLLPTLLGMHKHVVVSHYDWVFDNGTPRGCHFSEFPQPNRSVCSAFVVEPYRYKEYA